MKKIAILLLCVIAFVSCQEDESKVEQDRFDSENLQVFYDDLFVEIVKDDPEYINHLGDLSAYGVDGQKDKLSIYSEENNKKLEEVYKDALIYLNNHALEEGDLDYVNYSNVKWNVQMSLDRLKYVQNYFLLSTSVGEQRDLNSLLGESHLINNKVDAENWIDRVIMSEVKVKDMIQRYEDNLAAGYVMDSTNIRRADVEVKSMVHVDTERMPLYRIFDAKVTALDLSPEETQILKADAKKALETYFVPSMEAVSQSLRASLENAGMPTGVWQMPEGQAYYEHALKRHTTTSMTPDEIHELGLSEVKRIQEAMAEKFEALGYEGSLAEMLQALARDSKSYAGQEAMDHYIGLSRGMEAQLPLYFYEEDLPATSPLIKESEGGNYFMRPSIDGLRRGTYFIDLRGTHPDFATNTLAYHEMVPGHHMQTEHELLLENIPMVRKISRSNAYTEGWALYAEMFANENGFNTPAQEIGYLRSELHRAARLVVDTGLHAKQWEFLEAKTYLVEEGLLSSGYAGAEVSRYLAYPGQACSYKIGQLKILELRTLMEEAFGDAFDIKEFHHVILMNGSMPIELLESYVIAYIEDNK